MSNLAELARFLPVGEQAMLLEFADLDTVMRVASQLEIDPIVGVREVVAGARTVLLSLEAGRDMGEVHAALEQVSLAGSEAIAGAEHQVDVVYQGEDVSEVAALLSLSVEALIRRHTGTSWRAAFSGFAPGFAYLVADTAGVSGAGAAIDSAAAWDVPRRASPRPLVQAGSVGLAGEFSGIYPRSSPGGWQLIGRTNAVLFDPHREPAALISPGDLVHFTAVREFVEVSRTEHGGQPEACQPGTLPLRAISNPGTQIEVRATGPFTCIQDAGRLGQANTGLGAAGFADRSSARTANRLVGNEPGAALFEVLGGGLEFSVNQELIFAVTGAETLIEVSAQEGEFLREVRPGEPSWLHPGELLKLGSPAAGGGLRNYVSVRGGLAAGEVLGSQATDTLAGIGPELAPDGVHVGSVIPVHQGVPRSGTATGTALLGTATGALPLLHQTPEFSDAEQVTTLRILEGPRAQWFGPEAWETLFDTEWTVSEKSNRVGLRLAGEGASISRASENLTGPLPAELPSEPMVLGALQIPPDGQPILFHVDHPVTGGYPVIGVVVRSDMDKSAQLGAELV